MIVCFRCVLVTSTQDLHTPVGSGLGKGSLSTWAQRCCCCQITAFTAGLLVSVSTDLASPPSLPFPSLPFTSGSSRPPLADCQQEANVIDMPLHCPAITLPPPARLQTLTTSISAWKFRHWSNLENCMLPPLSDHTHSIRKVASSSSSARRRQGQMGQPRQLPKTISWCGRSSAPHSASRLQGST